MANYKNDDQPKVKVQCVKCGAEFEAPERLAVWMEKNPDKKLCETCFATKGKEKSTSMAPTTKSTGSATVSSGAGYKFDKATATKSKVVFEPKHFHKIMNEFEAEFGEEFELLVKAGALGGWVTTVLLARRDAGVLK